MKFFVPDKSREDAEKFCKTMRKKFVAWKISDVRIRGITYRDQGKMVQVTVGEWDPCDRRTVMAIVEGRDCYLIFERGRLADPIPVYKNEVSDVELFES